MPRGYAVVMGLALTLAGILGFVKTEMFGLHFSLAHNLIHLLSGLIGLAAGLSGDGSGAKTYAQVFGVIYTGVALAGFLGKPDFLMTTLHLNTRYNVIHIAVGLLGLVTGFTAARTTTA